MSVLRKSTLILAFTVLAAPAQAAMSANQLQLNTGLNRPVGAAAAAEDDTGLCGVLFNELQTAEKQADRLGGTPAAAKWSKLADKVWSNGEAVGCGWAS